MPAISRPLLIALIAAVVALVGFYAAQGARTASESADAPIAPEVPAERVAPKDDAVADAPKQRRAERDDVREVKRKAAPRVQRTPGVPVAVERALAQRKKVVLFFFSPGADDRATAAAVAGLRGRDGVVVFRAPIRQLARYRGLVGALGISQAPAIVIVGKDRQARLLEGYVDPATLAQDVADSR